MSYLKTLAVALPLIVYHFSRCFIYWRGHSFRNCLSCVPRRRSLYIVQYCTSSDVYFIYINNYKYMDLICIFTLHTYMLTRIWMSLYPAVTESPRLVWSYLVAIVWMSMLNNDDGRHTAGTSSPRHMLRWILLATPLTRNDLIQPPSLLASTCSIHCPQ